MRSRYHMSEMPSVAERLLLLAGALRERRMALEEVREQLAPSPLPPSGGASVPVPEDPPLVQEANMEGIRSAQRGDLARALELFDRVLELDSRHIGALFNRAKVLAMMRRREAAIAAYEGLLRRSPAHLPGLIGLAELKAERSPREAHALLLRAALSPGPPELKKLALSRQRELERILLARPEAAP
jgi:tetratricopeptide (TPR) repeat protein